VRRVGYCKPNLIIGGCLATIGSGLVYTFDRNTSPGRWIGYQILVGVGVALGWQQPLLSAQATVSARDLSSVTSMVLCECNTFFRMRRICNSRKKTDQKQQIQFSRPSVALFSSRQRTVRLPIELRALSSTVLSTSALITHSPLLEERACAPSSPAPRLRLYWRAI
jgi:hypothetical protein